jgi:hypothetical protein
MASLTPNAIEDTQLANVRVAEATGAVPTLSWTAHDRTHLEVTVVYPASADGQPADYRWEACFFAPRSFQLAQRGPVDADFRSRVRRAVTAEPFARLAGTPVRRVAEAIRDGDDPARRLRVFACGVQRASIAALERLRRRLDEPTIADEIRREVRGATELSTAVISELAEVEGVVVRRIDEYVSLSLETFLDHLALDLERHEALADVREEVVAAAVAQARYRLDRGYDSVVDPNASAAEIERVDHWRHTLKRYASSALWLASEAKDPRRWIRHALYSLAAGVAMAFAVGAALWNGANPSESVMSWLLIAVVAYVIKDRMKAALQGYFGQRVFKRLPDKRWILRDVDTLAVVATGQERTRVVEPEALPDDLSEARRAQFEIALSRRGVEELARPCDVVFHEKRIRVHRDGVRRGDEPYHGVVEVCRLDLTDWLLHTDDAKRRIVYADPVRGGVAEQKTPRVYDVDVYYRVQAGTDDVPWRKLRVVLSRKGIVRVDAHV